MTGKGRASPLAELERRRYSLPSVAALLRLAWGLLLFLALVLLYAGATSASIGKKCIDAPDAGVGLPELWTSSSRERASLRICRALVGSDCCLATNRPGGGLFQSSGYPYPDSVRKGDHQRGVVAKSIAQLSWDLELQPRTAPSSVADVATGSAGKLMVTFQAF